MPRSLLALPVAAALVITSMMTSTPARAAAPPTPGSVSSVTSRPGPNVGEITFTWIQDGSNTTGYVLRTALSSWSDTDPAMAKTGRQQRSWSISKSLRTITLTEAQVTTAGAGVATGNHLYFRFAAVNKSSSGETTTKNYPYLRAMAPRPRPASTTNGRIRVGSFNVRTARALQDSRTWLQRAPDVATEIVRSNAGVYALQELGPGRADGQTGTTGGTPRQTDSLLTALDKVNGSKYDLVRTTPYVSSDSTSGTQGMRILYDNTRYILRSTCPETTGGRAYSASCSIVTPILASDSESERRRAAVAQFEDRATGLRFFFVSAHLDARHSDTVATETSYDALRKSQANTIAAAVNSLNSANVPVVIAGDMNSWQNSRVNNSSHDTLIAQGYYDMSAAVTRTNFQYATINHFDTTMKVAAQGFGTRLDMILVKGATGAARFDNVMEVTDSTRPSDHNLITADFAPFDRGRSVEVNVRPPRRTGPIG
jgi:endonuclease/exonuclease/phosphatase family metal-dependent hydrolase